MTAEELTSVHEKLDRILLWQEGHTVRHEAIERDIGELRNETFGDGSPGMKARLQTIEQACRQRTCPAPWARWAWDVAGKVIAACLIIFIAWLLFAAKTINALSK